MAIRAGDGFMDGIQLVRRSLVVVEIDESALPGELVVAFPALFRQLLFVLVNMAFQAFRPEVREFCGPELRSRLGDLMALGAAYRLMLARQLVFGIQRMGVVKVSARPSEFVVALFTLFRELSVVRVLMTWQAGGFRETELRFRLGALVTLFAAYRLMLSQQLIFGVPSVRILQRPPGPAVGRMAFHAIRAKILWVRIFVTVRAFAEFEIDVPGLDCIFRPFFRVTLVAFYFRVPSGQRVICQ